MAEKLEAEELGHHNRELAALHANANAASRSLRPEEVLDASEEESRRRNKDLAALNAIAATVSSSLNLQEVLERALDQVLAVTGVDAGAIYLLDQQAGRLVLSTYRGVPKELADKVCILQMNESLAGQAVQSGEPVVVDDLSEDPRVTATLASEEGICSAAAIPIKSRENVQGVMHIASHKYHPFSPEEVWLYTAIANQIGVAMENARLYEQSWRQVQELSTLEEIARQINATLNVEQILELVLNRALQMTSAEAGAIDLLDRQQNTLSMLAGQGFPVEVCHTRPWSLDQGVIGRVVRSGQPALIADVSQDPDYVAVLPQTHSLLAAPMVSQGEVSGVIVLESPQVAAFGQEDLWFLLGLAGHTAIALENARLYETAQQEITERQQAQEALRKAHEGLERRVEERTAELTIANEQLKQEIAARKQAEEALRRRAEEMATLVELNRTITEDIGFKETLDRILSNAHKIIPVSDCSITLVDELSGDLVVQASTNGEIGLSISPSAPSAAGWVVKTKQILAEEEVSTNSIFDQQLAQRYGLKSALVVPIIYKDEAIGALSFGDQHARRVFSDGERIMAQAFAYQAAIAIQNAQLYSQLESRQHFIARILDSIPSSLVVIDRALRVVSVNHNFLEKTRREERATLGHKIEEVFPQVLLGYTRLDQKVREIFRTAQPVEGGKVAYRAPGLPTRIYFYRLIPLKVEHGVENVMLLMDDITEREQLGEEVRRAERHLASVVECANDVVVSLDPQGHIVTWNRAAETVSGLRAEQVKGQPLLSLCAAAQQPVMAQMLHGLARGEGVQHTEANLLTAHGQEVPIAWSCSPMRDDAGGAVGIVAVGRDLTERRRLEAQLIQSAKMASMGVMAGGIAHELRNPLGIISASAQLLLERPDDAQLHSEGAQKIHAATQRASLIIENLLKFARPSGERMREVDLHAVLEAALALLAHQMTLEKVAWQKEFQPGLPRVRGNPELLQQVFINLILNACNAMPQGGTLMVATRATKTGQVEIQFSDTGRGIPTEHLTKVFDPFFTTMPVGKGIGLGLSISYSLIQQHQGTIEATSQAGKGSTFTVRLPVTPVASSM
jgi:PAS domain S-box-containing protein